VLVGLEGPLAVGVLQRASKADGSAGNDVRLLESEGLPEQGLLRRAIGRRQAAGPTVLVHSGTRYDGAAMGPALALRLASAPAR